MRTQMFLVNLLVSMILLIAMLPESKFALSLDTQGYGSATDGSSTTALEPVLFSYFNGTDTEGWAMYLGSLQNPGNGGSGGGDGNGYLRTSPPSDSRTSYFVAPSQYHGDWSNFTELRFDMWSYGGTYYTSGYSMYGDVYLENNGKTAYLLLPRRPASDWESFFVTLDETENWTFGGGATSVHEVLSNVTDFQIRAEFGVGADHTGLDNVEIYGSSSCEVPFFSQIDESWNQHPLRGTCGGWCIDPDTGFVTIGRCGCTLTSSAMVFATYGADTNPQQLSDCMDNVACPYAWITGSTSCSQGKAQWVDQIPFSYSALEYQLNEKRRPVILGMHRKGSPEETHWVVVVNGHGSNPANYRMHDPAFKCGAVMTLAARSSDYDFDWLSVYEGQKTCHSLTAEIPQCVARGLNPQPIITMPDSSRDESSSTLIENHVSTSVVSGTVWLHTMTEITMTVEITAVSGVGTIENVMLWTDTLSNTTWQQFTPFIWLPKSDIVYVRFRDDLGNISEVYSATIHPQGPPTALISKIFLPSVNR